MLPFIFGLGGGHCASSWSDLRRGAGTLAGVPRSLGMDGTFIPIRSLLPLDTSAGLRRRAGEFLHVAASARDPIAWRELHRLAELYLQRAAELEAGGAARAAGNDNGHAGWNTVERSDTGD